MSMTSSLWAKKNITRIVLWASLVVFWWLWTPESEPARIGQYFLIGNIILLILLMELLPLWFRYYYRHILILLNHFAQSYDRPLSYSYTAVVLIQSHLTHTDQASYLATKDIKSDRSFFTIYHDNNLYEFSTDIIDDKQLTTLASVIIYYLQEWIPYEILCHHSKRIQHTLQ